MSTKYFMFTADLFIIARKTLRCPSIEEWKNNGVFTWWILIILMDSVRKAQHPY